jgi:DNA (cytosine-5)-methyltransferase 1
MNELALFAGAGGGILGGGGLGWRTVCAVERDAYASQILAQRQNDGILEPFPIWSDITTFNGKPWAGIVDVVSGGFPCQDISAAGKGAGIEGARSGMWKEMARIISEVRPSYAFVENSPMLTTRGLGVVLADLAKMGFDAEWGVLSAADVGAPHRRERIWIVGKHPKRQLANTNLLGHKNGQIEKHTTKARLNAQCDISASSSDVANTKELFGNGSDNNTRISLERQEKPKPRNSSRSKNVSNTTGIRQQGQGKSIKPMCSTQNRYWETNIFESISKPEQWQVEPNVGRVADGVAYGMDRLKAIGNGQVPLCAATAWELLK